MNRYLRLLITLTALVSVLLGAVTTSAQARTRPTYQRMTRIELSYARSVLALMNSQRADHGLPGLHISRVLTLSAAGHNVAMAKADTVSHQLPGEQYYSDRMRTAGWKANCASAENVGVNDDLSRDGALQLQSLMYDEVAPNDGHRQNLLGRRYTNVGVSVLLDDVNAHLWLTIDFGQRRCRAARATD